MNPFLLPFWTKRWFGPWELTWPSNLLFLFFGWHFYLRHYYWSDYQLLFYLYSSVGYSWWSPCSILCNELIYLIWCVFHLWHQMVIWVVIFILFPCLLVAFYGNVIFLVTYSVIIVSIIFDSTTIPNCCPLADFLWYQRDWRWLLVARARLVNVIIIPLIALWCSVYTSCESRPQPKIGDDWQLNIHAVVHNKRKKAFSMGSDFIRRLS